MASSAPAFGGRGPAKTVYDFFHQALRKPRNTPWDVQGPLIFGEEGSCVVFEVVNCEDRIADVRFKCTTCFTLVALCEHISELARGMNLVEASGIGPRLLLDLHPEVPPQLAGRADLASAAFQAALRSSTREFTQGGKQ
jgi:hypothetical protein